MDRKIFEKITIFLNDFFEFFLFFWGPDQTRPSHLGWAKTSPAQVSELFGERE
jgi:hypothetical protein